ncbi:MAG TPA: M20 family metallopeptidase [Aggregatilinea sp.]|jgi:glutamate carboxypeptidase|uniref:M20 family metallopeptidase n=1 Tax=Aggregatilinea sp. TaxID=2806333 RepID=UPI002BD49197|nr:M20 family metallopeptidase [Aggregatilinea sp.]HML23930.1 M20 family metallopeptidase [Aggregatilinea sp.]
MSELLDFFNARTEEMVERLEHIVRFETPTHNKEYVDRLGEYITEVCESMGGTMTVYPLETVGNLRLATWNADAPGKPLMILCHLDTVWPVGTLETMPLHRDGELLYGPGALDMKGGVIIGLEAVRGLVDRGELPDRPIWLLFNGDEETGSIGSRELICDLARQCGLVLVMEPAAAGEGLKTWRKGIARYTVHTKGRASHSGNAPEAGINAVIEAAHQALILHELNDLPNGTSVSVTVIHGGIAMNVIPPEASIQVDVRFLKASEAERVDRAVKALQPVLPGAEVIVEGCIDRGPMERNAQMVRAFQQAQAIGRSIGLEFGEDGSGGASDGNFTAAMGIPTLDGMGAGGIGLHAAHEQVVMSSLPRRAALVAQMLVDWDVDAVIQG